MPTWSAEQLESIGGADELEIASRRPDGSLRPFVTIWVVRLDDDIFIRSAHGRENGWFRHAVTSGSGRIKSGGVESDVVFDEPGPGVDGGLDAIYHSKYDRYPSAYVSPVVGEVAARATLRLIPAR